jgi:hypothetical protein
MKADEAAADGPAENSDGSSSESDHNADTYELGEEVAPAIARAWTLLEELLSSTVRNAGSTVTLEGDIQLLIDAYCEAQVSNKAGADVQGLHQVDKDLFQNFEKNQQIFDNKDLQNFLLANFVADSPETVADKVFRKKQQVADIAKGTGSKLLATAMATKKDLISSKKQGGALNHLQKAAWSFGSAVVTKAAVKVKRETLAKRLFPINSMSNVETQPIHSVLAAINEWDFDIFQLNGVAPKNALSLVANACLGEHNLVTELDLNDNSLQKFLANIQNKYFDHSYHCALHGADVTQTVHFFLNKGGLGEALTPIQRLAALVAAMIHDVGHVARSNNFLGATHNDLAITYSYRSPLEKLHCAIGLQTLKEHNFLCTVDPSHQSEIKHIVVEMVLATDNALHAIHLGELNHKLEADSLDLTQESDRMLVLEIALHSADVSNPAKDWALCTGWTHRVVEEFYLQGDAERKLGLPISFGCDRVKPMPMHKFQVGFIGAIVQPLYESFAKVPGMKLECCLEQLGKNKDQWQRISTSLKEKAMEASKNPTKVSAVFHCAKALQDTQLFGSQDPYVTLSLGEQQAKSGFIDAGGTDWKMDTKLELRLEPTEDGDFVPGATELLIQIWNANVVQDDLIGSTTIPLSDERLGFKAWYDLHPEGAVQITIMYAEGDVQEAQEEESMVDSVSSWARMSLFGAPVGEEALHVEIEDLKAQLEKIAAEKQAMQDKIDSLAKENLDLKKD